MANIYDYRRANLLRVIEQRGGVSNVGRILGYTNGSFLTQMTGPNPERRISENSARKYESTLELPMGALDMEVDIDEPMALVKREVAKPMTNSQISDLIMLIGKTCEEENINLPTAKFATLVSLALEDRRPDHVYKLIQLMK